MNDSRLDAGLRPGISTFPMKHQILTIRLSLQSVFRFCRQIYTQPSYADTWHLLLAYDEGWMDLPPSAKPVSSALNYECVVRDDGY